MVFFFPHYVSFQHKQYTYTTSTSSKAQGKPRAYAKYGA